MAPAHAVGNKVEAAYRRGDLFEKRISMMRDWADFCAGRACHAFQFTGRRDGLSSRHGRLFPTPRRSAAREASDPCRRGEAGNDLGRRRGIIQRRYRRQSQILVRADAR